jgi:hypothetical protein
MTISGVNLSATVPAGDIRAGTTKTFEYYFSMSGADGSSYTFPDTSPESSPYSLPIKPRVVYIKIPVTTPSGEQRFLQISYEE